MKKNLIQVTNVIMIRESLQDLGNKGPFEILEKYKRKVYISFYEILNKISIENISNKSPP